MTTVQRGSWRMRMLSDPRCIDLFHIDAPDRHFYLRAEGARNVAVQETHGPMDASDEMLYRRIWGCLGAITLSEGVFADQSAKRYPQLLIDMN